jgi:tyrosine-specific transport protein
MSNDSSKFIGSTLILVGTTIGAGMLALPTICAAAGFTLAASLMTLTAILSIITGLLVIEINLACPTHACTFSSMAEQTIGPFGKAITWLAYLLLLYSITTAYIAGESSLIINTLKPILKFDTPNWIPATLFTLVLGAAVFWSTETVDYFNRSFISIKGLLLLVTLVLIMPKVDISKLAFTQNIGHSKYLLAAIPIFLAAFCSQFVIPSVRIYIGAKPKTLKWIVTLGILFSLAIYLLWLAATLGTVPLNGNTSFTSWAQSNGSVGEFTAIVTSILNNRWVTSSVNSFTNIAMTTSFLGVSLGLFDFLADGFKRPNTRVGRLQTSLLTFIPPLAFALLFPEGFEKALTYAAVFLSILVIILPAIMAYNLRKNPNLKSPYRVFGGNTLLALVFISGIVIIVLSITSNLNLLPKLGG